MLLNDSTTTRAACRFEAFDIQQLERLTRALREARATGRYTGVLALAAEDTPPGLTAAERTTLLARLGRLQEIEAPLELSAHIEFELDRLDFLRRACEQWAGDESFHVFRGWAELLPLFALRIRIDWHERERLPALWLIDQARDGSAKDGLRLVFGGERFMVDDEEPIAPREGDLIERLASNYTDTSRLLAANRGLERIVAREVDDLRPSWSTAFAATMRSDEDAFVTAMRRARRALARLIRMRTMAARRGLGVFASDGFGDGPCGPLPDD